MSSIRDATIAVDTNVFVFALRKTVAYPACETLLFDTLTQLHVYVPLQVLVELRHNVGGIFVSENRHFLRELSALPFEMLNSQQAIDRLAKKL